MIVTRRIFRVLKNSAYDSKPAISSLGTYSVKTESVQTRRNIFIAACTTGKKDAYLFGTVQGNKSTKRLYSNRRLITPFGKGEAHDIHEGDSGGPMIVDNNEAEYLIVGGGIMGVALAFNIWRCLETLSLFKASKQIAPKIVVVERDPTMTQAATPRSVGSMRQQFSHPSNIKMSMATAEFIRDIKLNLGLAGHDEPNIDFQPQGYLFLASEKGAEQLMKNYHTQTNTGAKVMLMSKKKLNEVFPWINLDGIELGTYGLENEGWFDPWSFLNAFKTKMKSFGVKFVHGEVVGFKKQVLTDVRDPAKQKHVVLPDGTVEKMVDDIIGTYVQLPGQDKPICLKTANIINCGGPFSKQVAEMAGIGVAYQFNDHPLLKTELPVKPRKRYVYTIHCPDGPIHDCPLLVDPSGAYFRREGFGGMYVCGMSPLDEEAVDHSNLEVDYDYFTEEVWPRLAHRVPALERLKLKSAWAGYYDYNTFDQNAVIGCHPYYRNFHFLTGFSGHGIQMAHGASVCLAELLTSGPDKYCERIDIEPFSFNRLVSQTPLREINIV